jgi:uncharacterized membrane protein
MPNDLGATFWVIPDLWATGARTLLGAVASSTIAVAGTVFSIAIATTRRGGPLTLLGSG